MEVFCEFKCVTKVLSVLVHKYKNDTSPGLLSDIIPRLGTVWINSYGTARKAEQTDRFWKIQRQQTDLTAETSKIVR